jgi:hypothetical protein
MGLGDVFKNVEFNNGFGFAAMQTYLNIFFINFSASGNPIKS